MNLSYKRRDERLSRVVNKRLAREQISKAKARCKRQKTPWHGRRQSERIQVPFALHIGGNKNRRTVIKFLEKLRAASLQRKLRIILDFSECEVINAAGMLLFIAELDRIKRILGDSFSINIENVRNRLVNQVLYQIGLYSMCGTKRHIFDESDFDETVKHWRYATGERVNDQTNKAFENIEGRLSPELARGMWKGVSEAVINSVQHAYAAPRGVNGPRLQQTRWWMFSQEKDGELTVAVCDLGIGIPRSLPLNWEPGLLARISDSFSGEGDDVRAIRAALEVGASSTGKSHRGKGLNQIWNTLRSEENSTVAILSNRGQLGWSCKSNKETAIEFSTSIAGTIVIWTVQIPGAPNDG